MSDIKYEIVKKAKVNALPVPLLSLAPTAP